MLLRLILGMFLCFVAPGAYAQRVICPARPPGNNTNECNDSALVMQNLQVVLATRYGARCNGSHDDTSDIQAAINAAEKANGAIVLLPPGTCLVSSTLTIGSSTVQLRGSGRNTTVLSTSNGTSDVVTFNGTTFDSTISELQIISTAASPTAGAAISSSDCVGDVRIYNVRIEATFNGITTNNSSVCAVMQISHVDIANTIHDDIYVNGISQIFGDNIAAFHSSGGTGAGLHIQGAGAFYFVNFTPGNNKHGILMDPPSGSLIQDGFLSNVEIDSCSGDGFAIDTTGGGTVYNMLFTNIRVGFCGGRGYVFNGANTSNIVLANFTSLKNVEEGMKIFNLHDSLIEGGQILGNSASGGTFMGIDVSGGTGLTIAHNRIGSFPGAGGNNQPYGIQIESTFAGIMSVLGNDLRGNVTGGLNNASTSTRINIQQNTGYNPVGVKVPSLGASPWIYTASASPEYFCWFGSGTVTHVSVGGLDLAETNSGCVYLSPGQQMVMTYSGSINVVSSVQ